MNENINFYAYFRVSTNKQEFDRQVEALNKWQEENNIIIPKENIFVDSYTGKRFDRKNYQKLKEQIKKNDFLIVKEVERFGRDWDGIKDEWKMLKDNGINIIILDMPILSDKLQDEPHAIDSLDSRLLKEQIFTLLCYVAQKEREKISLRTKETLAAKKKNGTKSGRPIGRVYKDTTTRERFFEVLKYMIDNNIGQDRACYRLRFPNSTFKKWLTELYEKHGTKDYKKIYESEVLNK